MPACPNCGRQTLRTKDWACQWCGYPLLSRAYKKLDKTFKELQQERSSALRTASSEAETESEIDTEPEPELEPEPSPEPEEATEPPPDSRQKRRFVFERKPKPKEEPRPEPEKKPEPVPASELEPEPEPAPEPVPAPVPEPQPEPESRIAPPAAPVAESVPVPQLAPRPVPKSLPEPEPAPVAAPNLDTLTEGMVLSVDELDALFKANRLGAHARLANKTIVVKGLVEKVFIRDHIDVRYIVLTGAGKKVLWPVRCTFGKESIPQMNRLEEGQEVALRGRYDSYGKNIIFKDCVLA
jgi:hypothetical protein